ncbi:uncharacterized protein GIQ15_02745 [Arthroderma uncinatum]|uniref:uncharacterized protein n=1 Tax=Arthroderma uncinatum TaxID=74035 RepID=UPI00144AE20A|nr:uncharacterized protein GIQ15_02745 [Arthroderma uncinatum]KAF3483421.1 hypothetical protein GIQ15_02745 [Arthroderma uncinatum]
MLAPSNRYELHQSALISAAGLPRSAYSSPNTPAFCHQQQNAAAQSMAYEQASVPATTMAASSYFPKYQPVQYPQAQPISSDYMYSSMSQPLSPYDQYAMASEAYYDTYLPSGLSMAYFQQQDADMLSSAFNDTPPTHAHLSLPAMDSNTAFSTPDMPSNQQFPEPKTPPPPTSSSSSCESVRDDDDLVGVGLYDEPLSTSFWEESLSSSVDPILYPHPLMRKGLKLEETLDPSTLNCSDMDADGDDEEEEEQNDQTAKDADTTSKCHDSNTAAGLNTLNDGHLFPVDDAESYNPHVNWTAAPAVMLNSFAAFPGSYQNFYSTY